MSSEKLIPGYSIGTILNPGTAEHGRPAFGVFVGSPEALALAAFEEAVAAKQKEKLTNNEPPGTVGRVQRRVRIALTLSQERAQDTLSPRQAAGLRHLERVNEVLTTLPYGSSRTPSDAADFLSSCIEASYSVQARSDDAELAALIAARETAYTYLAEESQYIPE